MIASEGGPFDLILGIPVHPLVVHAAVVFIPLAAVGTVVMALSMRFSKQYGWLVVLAAASGAITAFVAKMAGEALAERVGEPGFNHAGWGSKLPFLAIGLLGVALALWLLDRSGADRQGARRLVSIAALVVAAVTLFWVIRVGHTGAQSVWSGVASLSSGG